MLEQIKTTVKKADVLGLFKPHAHLTAKDVAPAREYITQYWTKLQRSHPDDDESLLGVPHPYLVPASEEGHEFDFNELYYWDSYFMIQGLFDEKHANKELVTGVLEDLISLFQRFKIIPNASRTYLMGRSQPPLLTSFIWDVYNAYGLDHAWLGSHLKVAEEEYKTVWMGNTKPNWRLVHRGLSRYFDINMLNDLAEAESGWDMTPRFNRRALNFLPADLNSLLFKYEMDMARYYRLIDDKRQASRWEVAAEHRKDTMNELMWSSTRSWYYDYNYEKKRRSSVGSLAGFYPMWAGMVDQKRAGQMVKALRRYENRGGLATTDSQTFNQYVPGAIPTQWAYPNGWAPLHLIVIQGLERYGFREDARRIALKWLKTNLDWFSKNGVFLEKYNVVSPDKPPIKGVYPTQVGFGWTNGVFEKLCRDYIDE